MRSPMSSIVFIILISLVACSSGGGGTSVSSGGTSSSSSGAPFTATLSGYTSIATAGAAFRNSVLVSGGGSTATTYKIEYGPPDLNINSKGEITWENPIDFGSPYLAKYGISVTNGSSTKLLEAQVTVNSNNAPLNKIVTFNRSWLQNTRGDLDQSKIIQLASGNKALIATANSQSYSIIKLTDGKLDFKNIYPALAKGESIVSIGNALGNDLPNLLIRNEKNAVRQTSEKSLAGISLTGNQQITIFDATGDGVDDPVRITPSVSELDDRFEIFDSQFNLIGTYDATGRQQLSCDADGDKVNEVFHFWTFENYTNNFDYFLNQSIIPVINPQNGLCDTVVDFKALTGVLWAYWLKTGSSFDQISKVFLDPDGQLTNFSYVVGLDRVVAKNASENMAYTFVFEQIDLPQEYQYNAKISVNMNFNSMKITSSYIQFATQNGVTLASSDEILGVADLDNDGDDEIIFRHSLKPTDSDYSSLMDYSSNYHQPAFKLVAANIKSGLITPKYVSDVFPGGNLGNTVSFSSSSKLTVLGSQLGYTLTNSDRSIKHAQLELPINFIGAVQPVGADGLLTRDKTSGLSLYINGIEQWTIPTESLGISKDSASEPDLLSYVFAKNSLAIVRPFPTVPTASNNLFLINLTNGTIVDRIGGTTNIKVAPDFENSGMFYMFLSSDAPQGIYTATSQGFKLIENWTAKGITRISSESAWVNADQDNDFEIITYTSISNGSVNYTIQETSGQTVKSDSFPIDYSYQSLAEGAIPFIGFFPKCLKWDSECRISVSPVRNRLVAIDKLSGKIIWATPEVNGNEIYSWDSAINPDGSKSLVINSDEITWF